MQIGSFELKITICKLFLLNYMRNGVFWKEDGLHLNKFSIGLLSTAKPFMVSNLALKWSW